MLLLRAESAHAPLDPLDNRLTSRARGQAAWDQLKRFAEDIRDDLKNLDTVIAELNGALRFALAGYSAADNAASRITGYADARGIANELVTNIKAATRDPALQTHSNLDAFLARDLLSG